MTKVITLYVEDCGECVFSHLEHDCSREYWQCAKIDDEVKPDHLDPRCPLETLEEC